MLKNFTFRAITVIVGLLSIISFLGCESSKKVVSEIRIGAVLAQTGSLADLGNHSKNGLLLGVDTINEKGGIKGRKISLILEDSKTDPKSAVGAITKLINVDKVKFVIGDLSSGTTLAMAPVAEKAKVVLLAPGASNPQMREAGDFIFRNWVSDEFDGKVAASYATRKIGLTTFGVIEQQNAYCKGLSQAFQESASQNKGKILSMIPIQDNSLDHRDAVAKIISTNPQAVYLATHTKEGASAVRQLKEAGYKGMVIGNLVVESPDFAELAKGAMEGIIYTAPFLNEQSATGSVADFFKKYVQRFGAKPDAAAAHAFDAISVLALAIDKAKTESADDIKNFLYTVKDFPGASGVTSFDEKGDVTKPLVVKKVKNGTFTDLEVFIP